jgi:hypothetical protein
MSSYVTAFEHFNEQLNTLKVTTGSVNLDSLIDRCNEGIILLIRYRLVMKEILAYPVSKIIIVVREWVASSDISSPYLSFTE